MASSQSGASHKSYLPQNTPCVDCATEAELECLEPECASSSELTAQCTDQCVVIACSDPDHPESICEVGNAHAQCYLGCDDAIHCGDCLGFDNFLQCCDDPYGVDIARSTPQTSSSSQTALDVAFEAFLCGCDPKSLNAFPEKPHHFPHQHQFAVNSIAQQTPVPKPLASLAFTCMWGDCHASFSSSTELVGHVNLNHLANSTPTLDSECITGAPHQETNPQKPQSPISCLWGDCSGSYHSTANDSEQLANHLMNDHLGLQAPFTHTNHRPLPDYVKEDDMHTATHTFDQDFCLTNPPQTSTDAEPLSPIISSDHTCTGTHSCHWKNCGSTFHSCDDLTVHINGVHIGGGKAHYDCFWDDCSRNGTQGFQSKQKICRHVQSHTGHRPFQCDVCQQYFSEAATLQQHKRRHTQEKPYVCDFPGCGKSFAITGALTIHKRMHNGDKPFKCIYCDRGFAESSNLSKHLRTHTGVRPYTCPEPGCQKTFGRPDQLNRHKSVHKNKSRV